MHGDFMGDDQVVLGFNRRLHVVTYDTGHAGCRGHGSRVWIAQRHLRFAGLIHAFLDRSVARRFLLQMFQLSQRAFHPCLGQHGSGLLKHLISAIQFVEITLNGLVDLTQLLAQLATRVILGFGIHCLEPATIYGDQVPVQQIDVATQHDELLADLADRRAVVLAEVSNRLEVRLQPARQPDEFQVATTLPLQPPRRLDLV